MEEIKIPMAAFIDLLEYFWGDPEQDRREVLERMCKDHIRFLHLRQSEREAFKKLLALPNGSDKEDEARERYMELHIDKVSLQSALYGGLSS